MFKIKPIQYKFQPKFIPTKDIYNKYIICEPFEWDNGYGVSFIIEVEIPLEGKVVGSRFKPLERYDYFDRDVRDYNYELCFLFPPLFNGEIRGKYAERVIGDIFIRLCRKEKWLEEHFCEYFKILNG